MLQKYVATYVCSYEEKDKCLYTIKCFLCCLIRVIKVAMITRDPLLLLQRYLTPMYSK